MKSRQLVALLLGGLLACSTEVRTVPAPVGAPAEGAAEEEPAAETPADDEPYELFGAELGDAAEVPFEDLLANPTTYRGTPVITAGVVRQNCQKKGCWMDVRPEDDRAAASSMTVRFKDYGFFVPLNSRGARVRMQGVVKVTTMTAEEVTHMEEEGAEVTGKKPDGSAEVIEFTATGVELRGRKKK